MPTSWPRRRWDRTTPGGEVPTQAEVVAALDVLQAQIANTDGTAVLLPLQRQLDAVVAAGVAVHVAAQAAVMPADGETEGIVARGALAAEGVRHVDGGEGRHGRMRHVAGEGVVILGRRVWDGGVGQMMGRRQRRRRSSSMPTTISSAVVIIVVATTSAVAVIPTTVVPVITTIGIAIGGRAGTGTTVRLR